MDQRIAIRAIGTEDFELKKFRQFKERTQNTQHVISTSAGTEIPGYYSGGGPPWTSSDKPDESNFVSLVQTAVEFDYMKTLNIPVIAGWEFTEERMSDERVGMINETALRHLGLTSPDEAIGKSLYFHWFEEKEKSKSLALWAIAISVHLADHSILSFSLLPTPLTHILSTGTTLFTWLRVIYAKR